MLICNNSCHTATKLAVVPDLRGVLQPPEPPAGHAPVNGIKEDNFTAEKRRIATLQSWKENFAFRATYQVLVQALIESGRVQKALDLCHKIKELQTASESDGTSINTSRDPLSEPMSPVDSDSASEEFTII